MGRQLLFARSVLQRISLLLAAAVLCLPMSFAVARPAAAATIISTDQLVTNRLQTDFSRSVLLRLPATSLEAGRPYLLTGSYGATSPIGSLQAMVMRCHAAGVASTYSAWSTRNNPGAEYGNNGLVTISGQWLFTPQVSADYVCEVVGQAGRVGINNQYINVQAGQLTLDVDGYDPTAALEWRQPADARFGNPNSDCCSRPRAVDVLWNTWTVPEGTKAVRVYTGPEVSVESTGGSSPLRVRLTHFVRQLDDAGKYCRITKATQELTIDNILHHYKFNQVQEAPYDPNCGNRFNVKVYVEYLPGTPERHGGVVHGSSYSSAYIVALQ